jgi:hypothetical protein
MQKDERKTRYEKMMDFHSVVSRIRKVANGSANLNRVNERQRQKTQQIPQPKKHKKQHTQSSPPMQGDTIKHTTLNDEPTQTPLEKPVAEQELQTSKTQPSLRIKLFLTPTRVSDESPPVSQITTFSTTKLDQHKRPVSGAEEQIPSSAVVECGRPILRLADLTSDVPHAPCQQINSHLEHNQRTQPSIEDKHLCLFTNTALQNNLVNS